MARVFQRGVGSSRICDPVAQAVVAIATARGSWSVAGTFATPVFVAGGFPYWIATATRFAPVGTRNRFATTQ